MTPRDENVINFIQKALFNAMDSITECDTNYYYEQGMDKDGNYDIKVFNITTDEYIMSIDIKTLIS